MRKWNAHSSWLLSLLALGSLATSGCAASDSVVGESIAAVTARKGVDYSFDRPSPQGLRAAGYTFAVRYLSYDNTQTHGKILTAGEATALMAAGLDVVSNWEFATGDAKRGYNGGAADAQEAQRQATAAGMPAGRPIYFSVDYDAQGGELDTVSAYFDGVASVIGVDRTGAYGGYRVIKRLFDTGKIRWGWQTFAWSGGQWDARVQLRQVQNGVPIAGGDCDIDSALADDFGQWSASSSPGAGVVHEVYADSAGWHDGDTGLAGIRSISAVNMGGAHPQAMGIKDGILHQIWGDDSGWHAGSTGIAATAVSAVNVGETWPRAMIVGSNSRLYEVYADANGWHSGDTGVQVKKISAVYMGSGVHPQVMATDNGDNLLQIWADNSGWHVGQTGIQANNLSAVNMGGVWPQVVVTSNSGHVVQVWGDSSGWHAADTGTVASTVSAVNMGAVWPQIMATRSDGHLVQIWGDSAGWHSGDTGVLATNASAVSFGGTWPRIFTTR